MNTHMHARHRRVVTESVDRVSVPDPIICAMADDYPSQALPKDLVAEVRQGDAYDLMAKLPAESVDLIITSPPYWGLRTYGQEHNEDILAEWVGEGGDKETTPPYDWYRFRGGLLGLEPLPEWFVDHLVEIFQRGAAAVKPGGSLGQHRRHVLCPLVKYSHGWPPGPG